MKRIVLFVLTNLAVMIVISVVVRVLGLDRALEANGLNLGALLAYSAVVGFAGAIISLLVLAAIIVAWFSRRREFRADAGSARYLGSPQPMMHALARLGGLPPGELPKSLNGFGIVDKAGIAALFATHPPIEARIRALQAQ